MPDALDLLKQRRSVRIADLREPGPAPAQLDTILAAAARVPDHGKLAPWRFIVFAGEARRRAGAIVAEIAAAKNPGLTEDQRALEQNRFLQAPLVVGVISTAQPHPKIPEWEQVLSAGAAAMNLIVAANALGFGTNWVTHWYAYDARARAALGLAPHEQVAGFIHIGTTAARQDDRPRPDLAQIVTHFGA